MININTQRINSQLYTVAETYNSLRLPVDKAATLIPDSYTSREFFTLELEKVFANGWIAVGCLQQVSKPGHILVVEVAGRSILIVCDKKGNLGAFYNVCRHRGSKLLEESCKRKSITCPYHAWNYGLDGKCMGTSMFNNNANNLNSTRKVNLEKDLSKFDKKNSSNVLTVNNFKLNKAPALAKLLTLADLRGLTDTLKGEGISFDTLLIKYESNPSKMDVKEIFMIGPSISILIEGYVEKKNGLISLRGTLVPAKTLNSVISKIPIVGDILIGKKVGEGLFGISFKIKGLPDNLKTTVNPVKTLTPRFITRALEASKKKNSRQ